MIDDPERLDNSNFVKFRKSLMRIETYTDEHLQMEKSRVIWPNGMVIQNNYHIPKTRLYE
jgi:hypothetical protein